MWNFVATLRRAFEDEIEGGKADDKDPADFNIVGLLKGIIVELEHTDDPIMAMEIAMDHLTEDPRYYDALQVMEKALEGGGEGEGGGGEGAGEDWEEWEEDEESEEFGGEEGEEGDEEEEGEEEENIEEIMQGTPLAATVIRSRLTTIANIIDKSKLPDKNVVVQELKSILSMVRQHSSKRKQSACIECGMTGSHYGWCPASG